MKIDTAKELAKAIDHTLLDGLATEEQIREHCRQAVKYGFYSVCIQPRWVDLAAGILRGSGVKVGTVVGFPFGTEITRVKAFQAETAIMAGADEIDMVADLCAVVSADSRALMRDIESVARVCRSLRPKATLKVIIESAALSDQQIVFACQAVQQTGADFVKTSTGFHPAGGAKIEHVRLMKQSSPNCQIKAAGGICTPEQAAAMIQAGASRLGTSKSVEIIEQFRTGLQGR